MDAPNPAAIFNAMTGYQRTAALKAAVELDVFTAIGEGLGTAEELAPRCQASPRGLRSLCDRLVVDGFLTKTDGRWGLTPNAAIFLDRRSPACMGSMVHFFTGETISTAFNRLTEAVRRGGTALDAEGTVSDDNPVWVEFARHMAPIATAVANVLAGMLGPVRGSVLDIAAGHGAYGVTLAQHNPEVTVTALDWKNVLAVAAENARTAGVADRVRMKPGSAFDTDLGGGHALVLLTNFLHHFDPPTCEELLRRVHASLAPGGRAVVVEFVPDENRVTPPEAAAFSLTMLATTPHGDAWTLAEYERMFRGAGFSSVTLHQLVPTPQQAIVAER